MDVRLFKRGRRGVGIGAIGQLGCNAIRMVPLPLSLSGVRGAWLLGVSRGAQATEEVCDASSTAISEHKWLGRRGGWYVLTHRA
jgi:hypothetical protein